MNIRRWLWNWLGGRGVAEYLKTLSHDIIDSRRRENDLFRHVRELEIRMWNLEKHTPEETLAHCRALMEEYSSGLGDELVAGIESTETIRKG